MVFKFLHFTLTRARKRALDLKFTPNTVRTRRAFHHEIYSNEFSASLPKDKVNRVQFIPSNEK